MKIISDHADESSKLYHLEPITRDTMFQESLTGYIARLAQNHLIDVSQLINYELVPVCKKNISAGLPFMAVRDFTIMPA